MHSAPVAQRGRFQFRTPPVSDEGSAGRVGEKNFNRRESTMRASEVIELLEDTGNQTILLEAGKGSGAVIVAPGLVGRVMCSTFDRKQGLANAWVNDVAIRKGRTDPVFNNFGGEERIWFAPEGGQFGLMFGRKESRFDNYCVQPAMSSIEYQVTGRDASSVRMEANLSLENNSATQFRIHVDRRVSLLDSCPYCLEVPGTVECVGFQSENILRNVGSEVWTRTTGTVNVWCLGQFLEHPHLSVVIPVRSGIDPQLHPPTVDEYFKDFCLGGIFPPERRVNLENSVLLKVDGEVRGKVGVKKERAMGRLGSYDAESGHLVIVDHDFYPELDYPSGYWRQYDNAFDGDALSVYIDGPERVGGAKGQSYELETMSPGLFLRPGDSFSYRNRTFHIRGDREDINLISRRFLKADLKQIEAFTSSVT